ncbi:MAG TPA: type II secretion system F family protein [Patescibacteria group bacterium]|nr:type II secretion system F family protein [Patescibacteria group bacterium]
MPTFTYTAVTKEGKTVNGSIDSTSKESLMESLQHQGYRPLIIKQKTGFKLGLKIGKSNKVKLKDLVIFTRQLSTMISAGVPLNRSLNTLQVQAQDKYFKTAISEIAKDIEGGSNLGDAFSKYPNIFSEIYVNMVRAGEAGGILDEILKRLALQVEKDSSIRKKIKGAMMYPMVVGSITVVAFFGIMIFVMPKITSIINNLTPNAKLPIYSQIMINTSHFVQKNSLIIILTFIVVIFGVRFYIRSPKGKVKFHLLLLNTPIIKDVITKIAIARFSRTFASLMSAGVGVLEALDVTGGAIGNKIIESELKKAAKEVKNGKQLSEPLSKSKYFPPIVSQMLAVGEETGQIDTILLKVADFYEEEVDTVINSLSALIEPIMIVILGAIVGLIAASVMGPIASLSKNIGQ